MTKIEFANVEVFARHQLQAGWTRIKAKDVLVTLIETPTKPVVQVFYKAGRMRKWHAINWGCQVVVASDSEPVALPDPHVTASGGWLKSRYSLTSPEWLYELTTYLNASEAEILWQGECNDALGHCQIKLQAEPS